MITASRIKMIVVISGDSSAMPSGSTPGKRETNEIELKSYSLNLEKPKCDLWVLSEVKPDWKSVSLVCIDITYIHIYITFILTRM